MDEINELFYNLRLALASNNGELFESLCDHYELQIVNNFKTWTKVPEPVRNDTAQRNLWAGTLMQIARFFESKGKPGLLDILIGNTTTNPITRLQNSYIEAQGLFEGGKYNESISLLLPVLAELKTLKGPFADNLIGMVNGLVGSSYLKLGMIDNAEEYTRIAMEKCKEFNDAAGVTAYDENMRLIRAYKAYTKDKNCFLIEVRNEIVRAQKLSDNGNFNKSTTILNDILQKVESSLDPFVKRYCSKIYGLIGLNYFRINKYIEAEKFTLLALQLTKNYVDRAGTFIYNQNLKEIRSLL